MRKNNPIRDCINLSYIQFLQFKNYIKVTLTNPLTAIKSGFTYMMPFVFMALPLFTGKAKPKIVDISVKDNFTLNIISLVVTSILIITLLYSLYSAVSKYKPTQFSISDANYLFSSPIEPRTIYFWTMVRSSITSIGTISLLIIMYIIYGYRYFKIHLSNFVYVAFGLLLLGIVLKAITFFVYSICMRFRIKNVIKTFVYGLMVILSIYLLGSIIYYKDILKGLFASVNGNLMSNVPIVGWGRDLLISPFFKQYNPLYRLITLLIVTIVVFFLAVYFATDYYEEAVESIEIIERNTKVVKSKNADELADLTSENEKKKKVKKVKSKYEFKGPWAFMWKGYVVNHRSSSNIFIYVITVIFFIGSMVIAYFSKKSSSDTILVEYLVITLSMLSSGAMVPSPLKYERGKQYLFLTPGKAWQKMIALHFWSFVNNFLLNIAITVPIIIMDRKVNIFGVLFLFLALCGTYIVTVFNKLLINLLLPSFDDGKNGFLMLIFDVVAFLPAAALGAGIGYLIKSLVIGLGIYVVGVIIMGCIYCAFMDELFKGIELK